MLSNPSEIMFVASATSTAVLAVGQACASQGPASPWPLDRQTRVTLAPTACPSSGWRTACSAASTRLAPRPIAGQTRLHFVFNDTPRAAEFTQCVEVTNGGHVGIGDIPAVLELLHRAGQQGDQRAQEDELRSLSLAPPDPRTAELGLSRRLAPSSQRNCRDGQVRAAGTPRSSYDRTTPRSAAPPSAPSLCSQRSSDAPCRSLRQARGQTVDDCLV